MSAFDTQRLFGICVTKTAFRTFPNNFLGNSRKAPKRITNKTYRREFLCSRVKVGGRHAGRLARDIDSSCLLELEKQRLLQKVLVPKIGQPQKDAHQHELSILCYPGA